MQKEVKLAERISISTSNIQLWNEFLEARQAFLEMAGEMSVEKLDFVFANPKEVEKTLTWMQALTCAADEKAQEKLDEEVEWVRLHVYAVYSKPHLRTPRLEEKMVEHLGNLNQTFSIASRGHLSYFSKMSAVNTKNLVEQTSLPVNNRVWTRVKQGGGEDAEDGETAPKKDEEA